MAHRMPGAEAERRLGALVTSSIFGVAVGRRGVVEEANDEFLRLTGGEAFGLRALGVDTPPADRHSPEPPGEARLGRPVEGEIVRRDGSAVPVLVAAAPLDEAGERLLVVALDISAQKAAEARLRELIERDDLTGLVNRRRLAEHLQASIAWHMERQRIGALLVLDLDRFKDINDTLGHDQGDALLRAVADRLKRRLRSTDVVARLGGDEFAVILGDLAGPEEARRIARKVMSRLSSPFVVGGNKVHLRGTAGAALFPGDGTDPRQLLKNADMALHRAKQHARGDVGLFDPGLEDELAQRRAMAEALRHGIATGEFSLVYQPKVALQDGAHRGFEALLRWRSRGLGPVLPASFIPVAEEAGLIVPLGRLVLKEAIAQLRSWLEAGLEPGEVAVNVAAAQLKTGDLPGDVTRLLARYRVAPRRLCIEVTENVLLDRDGEQIATTLRRLHELGVTVALDDFGTGYASLSHLKRFRVDRLKIDQSFVRDIGRDPDDAAIARTIINLAHSLGMTVVAEGIESRAQEEFLRLNGCDYGQGYLYAAGLCSDQSRAYLGELAVAGAKPMTGRSGGNEEA